MSNELVCGVPLHPFQRRTVTNVEDAAKRIKRIVVTGPGGCGKSHMIAELAVSFAQQGRRVLVTSHRREIIQQNTQRIRSAGASADHVEVISIHKLIRRRARLAADVVIVDECHRALAPAYKRFLDQYEEQLHIGFTATPFRMDGVGLKDHYQLLLVAAYPSELINAQMLAKPLLARAAEAAMPDLRGLAVQNGEYASRREVAKRVMRQPLAGNVVHEYKEKGRDRPAVLFAVSIAHAEMLADRFNENGVSAVCVSTKDKAEDRKKKLEDFKAGKYRVVCSCEILTEGWDLPACRVVILARPTRSLGLYLQMCSRGMRYGDGTRPLILDHARCFESFGLPEADRRYSLTETAAAQQNVSPVKDCPDCGHCVPVHAAECPECGHIFETVLRTIPQETEEKLQLYTAQESREMRERIAIMAHRKKLDARWVDQVIEQYTAGSSV